MSNFGAAVACGGWVVLWYAKLGVMNVMAFLHYLDLKAASIRTPATCKMRGFPGRFRLSLFYSLLLVPLVLLLLCFDYY